MTHRLPMYEGHSNVITVGTTLNPDEREKLAQPRGDAASIDYLPRQARKRKLPHCTIRNWVRSRRGLLSISVRALAPVSITGARQCD